MGKGSLLFASAMGGGRDVKNDSPYAADFGNHDTGGDGYSDGSMDVAHDSPYAAGFGTTNRGSGTAMGGSFDVRNVSKYAEGGMVDGDDYQCSDQEKLAAYELMDALGVGYGGDGDRAEKVARALKAFVMMMGG